MTEFKTDITTVSASVNAILNNEFNPDDVLLGYQKRWIADSSVLKVAEKSRRTGLTWAEACDATLTGAMSREAGGRNTFYVGSSKDMAREFIDACAMWAKAFNYVVSEIVEEALIIENERTDVLTFVIYFSSGFKVQALSSNPKNLRGMQGNVVIDEAAFHEYLPELLKAAMALTMWGAKVRIISTHNGTDNNFNELIQEIRKGKRKGVVHTITLDDACCDGLYRRICQVNHTDWAQEKEDEWKADLLKGCFTEDDALEEYYCVPKNGGGAYISRVLIDNAAKTEHKVIRYEMPKGHMFWTEPARTIEITTFFNEKIKPILDKLNKETRHAYGQDFARNGDRSTIAIASIEQNTARKMRLTIELHDVPYNQQRELAFLIIDNTPRIVGIATDATGNGGYLGEALLLRYSQSMVDAVHTTENFYREWSPKYKALYESGFIEIPKDEDIIIDQRHLQIIRGVPKIDKSRDKGQDGKKRHGDSCVAYIMAVRASYMCGFIAEFTALPSKHKREQANTVHNRYDDLPNYEKGCW
jgi:phage FluMu gp28-like protein